MCPETKRAASFYRNSDKNQDIFGFATRETYGCLCYHRHRWAFTPPFHPFPEKAWPPQGGYFLLRLYPLPEIFQLGSTVPCVARTFLPDIIRGDKAACRCKDNNLLLLPENYHCSTITIFFKRCIMKRVFWKFTL